MAETSKTGVWFDTKAAKVVEKQPEEGIQLVSPGSEITGPVQARIDNYKAVEAGETNEPGTMTTVNSGARTKK